MANEDGRGEAAVTKLDLFNDEFTVATPDTNTVEVGVSDKPQLVIDDVEAAIDDAVAKVITTKPTATGKFSREIDLGDGSGKQVFSGDTAEELVDALVKAQENATKKIRELSFEKKRAERAKPERPEAKPKLQKELSADELFALANELQKDPRAAINKIFQAETGKTAKEVGDFIDKIMNAEQINQADTQFLMKHQDDFVPSNANAVAINKFLLDEKLPHTVANLEYAFQELTESGLLEVAATGDDEKPAKGAVEVPAHTRRKPMSTGLRNTQGSAVEPPAPKVDAALSESEVEQLYKLPTEEARVLMSKFMARARSKQK